MEREKWQEMLLQTLCPSLVGSLFAYSKFFLNISQKQHGWQLSPLIFLVEVNEVLVAFS